MAIWADAVFVWDANHAGRSKDLVTDTDSDAALTEGATVTFDSRDGRTYDGAEGARFASPIADTQSGLTLVAAVRQPATQAEVLYAVGLFDSTSLTERVMIDVDGAAAGVGTRYRDSNGITEANWLNITDDAIHIIAVRFTNVDLPNPGSYLAEVYVDGALVASSRSLALGTEIDPDRLTVGRSDRDGPDNSTGGQVFAASVWGRTLTDAELRAVMDDPYSYPTDPSDPGWVTPTGVWADTVFAWDPNHGGRSLEQIHGNSISDLGVTEGDEVTVSTRDGRSYGSGDAARFGYEMDTALIGSDNHTQAVVVRVPSDGTAYMGSWVDRSSGNTWSVLGRISNGWRVRFRNSSEVIADAADAHDTDMHTVVATVTRSGSDNTVTIHFDDFANSATNTAAIGAMTVPMDRLSLGRIDDSSPSSGAVEIEVFAYYAWNKALSEAEIDEVMADPFAFPGAQVPDAPGNVDATATSASIIQVTWDDVADETGYRVERSPDGSGSWTDVSGNLAADTVLYDDTGLDPETQYFYRVFAFNANGDSAASSTVNATTFAASSGNRMGGDRAIRRSPRTPR